MATTQAFREYITQNQQAFYRLAYSYTKNSDAALDVVQDAIVKGIEKLHTLRNVELQYMLDRRASKSK